MNKNGSNPKKHEHIRQKIDRIGRLPITARKMTAVKEMKDLIDAKKVPDSGEGSKEDLWIRK